MTDLLQKELSVYEAEWRQGEYQSLILAFILCSKNQLPFPDWLHDALLEDLEFAYHNRPRGVRMDRRAEIQDRNREKHRARHGLVKGFLRLQELERGLGFRAAPPSKAEAARDAEKVLRDRSDPDRSSARAILESYEAVERGEF